MKDYHFGGCSKTRYRKLVTDVESLANAVSLLEIESGEQRCVKAINNNNYRFVFSMISTLFIIIIIDRFYVALFSALRKTLNETVSVFFFIARFYFILFYCFVLLLLFVFVLIFADVVY